MDSIILIYKPSGFSTLPFIAMSRTYLGSDCFYIDTDRFEFVMEPKWGFLCYSNLILYIVWRISGFRRVK
jgi:hypothetical protein